MSNPNPSDSAYVGYFVVYLADWENLPMGREAKLRRKDGYWFSEAGGVPRYYGRVTDVPHAEALRQFREALSSLPASPPALPPPAPPPAQTTTSEEARSPAYSDSAEYPDFAFTVQGLADRFLEWAGKHRGDRTHRERSRHLKRWTALYGPVVATNVRGTHLEAFQDDLRESGVAEDYVKKHATSVRACFNRACKMGWLPKEFRPFSSVEPIRLPPKPLAESELPTDEEVQALFGAVKGETLRDILTCYYHTGARTGELVGATVGDFQHKTRQLLLGSHKRSKTMKDPVPRRITLNDATFSILARRCWGRGVGEPIFPSPVRGVAWTVPTVGHAFIVVRKRAKVRDGITIYSFRHLWISEALMAGVDVLLVAKMAGTSVSMIERVYGHFRSQSFQQAQARLDASRQKEWESV